MFQGYCNKQNMEKKFACCPLLEQWVLQFQELSRRKVISSLKASFVAARQQRWRDIKFIQDQFLAATGTLGSFQDFLGTVWSWAF